MSAYKVSVLVRAHNDEKFVGRTLAAIEKQSFPEAFEIVSCDDFSTDSTPEIIRRFPNVRVLDAPAGGYVPGKTLNQMARAALGEILVFNNADAVPQNDRWLETLVKPLLDGAADAVYANQLPRPDADWLVRKDNLRAFGDGRIASRWSFFFSLASSAVFRKDVLENPFDETFKFSEDVEWAHRRNIKIGYAADALVEHSHNYTNAELSRRFYGEGYAAARIFGVCPSFPRALAEVCAETLRDAAFAFANKISPLELPRALKRRLIQKFSFRRGAVDFKKEMRK